MEIRIRVGRYSIDFTLGLLALDLWRAAWTRLRFAKELNLAWVTLPGIHTVIKW